MTTAKREALSIGDLSGLAVDPILVSVCELLGYLLRYQSHPDGWISFNGQMPMEAELDRLIRNKLEDVPGVVQDPLLCLQAYTMLSLYSMQKEDICGFQEVLGKASDIFLHHATTLGLEDAPVLEWCPMFDASYLSPRSTAEEVRSVFSLFICIDVAGALILNIPSLIDPGVLEKFRRLAVSPSFASLLNAHPALHRPFIGPIRRLILCERRAFYFCVTARSWSRSGIAGSSVRVTFPSIDCAN